MPTPDRSLEPVILHLPPEFAPVIEQVSIPIGVLAQQSSNFIGRGVLVVLDTPPTRDELIALVLTLDTTLTEHPFPEDQAGIVVDALVARLGKTLADG